MQIAKHPLTTRVLGKSQGYLGLPIVDVNYKDGSQGMWSYWTPTPAEIEAIVKGANVRLTVLGTQHPPVCIDVGEVPEDLPVFG